MKALWNNVDETLSPKKPQLAAIRILHFNVWTEQLMSVRAFYVMLVDYFQVSLAWLSLCVTEEPD